MFSSTVRRSKQEQLTQGKHALLVIDMQADFVDTDGLLARSGKDPAPQRAIIPRLQEWIITARQLHVPIIWIRTTHSFADSPDNYLAVHMPNVPTSQWKHSDLLCAQDTPGADWARGMPAPLEEEVIFVKHMYSAFQGTALNDYLRQQGIDTLLLSGVNTNICIHSTALDGFFKSYYVMLCEDATATHSCAVHEAFISTHQSLYGHTIDLTEYITIIGPQHQ